MRTRALSSSFFLVLGLAACGGARMDDAPTNPPGPNDVPPGENPNRPRPTCDAKSATDVAVSRAGLNGYPPYAVAECSLAYINRSGDLVLRDLATGGETTIAPIDEAPEAPAISIDPANGAPIVVWQATIADHSHVRVREGTTTRTISGAFDNAIEPRVSGHRVVFTAYRGPKDAPEDVDTDVWMHDTRDDSTRVVFGGKAQQRFPDINAAYVVASDFSEDPDGHYNSDELPTGPRDLADIVVYEIASGKITTRKREGKQAFPMLGNGDALAYLDWLLVHPEPKLVAYDLRGGRINAPEADREIAKVVYRSVGRVRPAMAGDTLEWIANPDIKGTTELWRAKVTEDVPAQKVAGLESLNLFAPAPSTTGGKGFTVLAVTLPSAHDKPLLRVVER